MPYSNSVTVNLRNYDYYSSTPSFATGSSYNGLIFANKTSTFHVEDTTYGYVVFKVSYTGPLNYLSVCFRPQNGVAASVATSLNNNLFIPTSNNIPVEWRILDGTGNVPNPSTFYVIVNAPQNPVDLLDVSIAAGVRGTPPVNSSVTIEYTCVTQTYKYEVGLHVYSPYDAQGSVSKLKTILYSLTPIEEWGINTLVYNSSFLQNAALPWYYGYGNFVYKIGGPFDRAYGNQVRYHFKKRRFHHPETTREIVGPQWWIVDPTTEPYHPNCVAPIMTDLGLVKQIFPVNLLVKPKYYRYYMGYDPANRELSNNSVFTVWSWSTEQNYPIIGSKHAILKLVKGIMEGFRYEWGYIDDYQGDYDPSETWLGQAGYGLIYAGVAVFSFTQVICAFINCNDDCPANVPPPSGPRVDCPKNPNTGGGSGNNTGGGNSSNDKPSICKLCYILGLVGLALIILGAILLLINLIVDWFTVFDYYKSEKCTNIQHFFSDTPYVSGNTRTTLFRNINISRILPGYHNDGCYVYTQNSSVYSKETNSISLGFDREDSTGVVMVPQTATRPDEPILVEEFYKLIILAYVSGKPLPYCGPNAPIYYNTGSTTTISTKQQDCCDLELCNDIVVTVPSGTTWSCASQADAEAQAQLLFNYQIEYVLNHHVTVPLPSSAYGEVSTIFTHELKIEQIPNNVGLTFDARISQTPRVGMKMYYDSYGCTLVLDGYYATTGTTPYRTFYRTRNGIIDDIQVMQTSASTTTNSGLPIVTTYRTHTSNWYLTETDRTSLNLWSNKLANTRHFNPNLLYTGYTLTLPTSASHTFTLKKGFINTPTTYSNFRLYDNFVGTSSSEATYGWYRPLIDWLVEPIFLYQPSGRTLFINISEECGYINGTTAARGVYLTCVDSNGVITGVDTTLLVGIKIFDVNGVLVNNLPLTFNFNINNSIIFYNLSFLIPAGTDIGSVIIISIGATTPTLTSYVAGTSTTCTTKICEQVWMTNNLDTKFYNTGDAIPQITDQTEWNNATYGAWCYYDNDPTTESTYGLLYNHYAIEDARGLAPRGWHVPSDEEFSRLSDCLGGDAVSGGALKEVGYDHWNFPNTDATNLYDFSGLPGGWRQGAGSSGINEYGLFWVSTNGMVDADLRQLTYNNPYFAASAANKFVGMSVRCLKD